MDFLSSAHVRWLLEHSVRCWVDKEWNPATLDSSGDVNSWMERVHAAVNDPSPEGNQTTLTSIWTPAGLQRHCLPCVFASVRWWFSLKRTCSIYWAPIHAYMCVCVCPYYTQYVIWKWFSRRNLFHFRRTIPFRMIYSLRWLSDSVSWIFFSPGVLDGKQMYRDL